MHTVHYTIRLLLHVFAKNSLFFEIDAKTPNYLSDLSKDRAPLPLTTAFTLIKDIANGIRLIRTVPMIVA